MTEQRQSETPVEPVEAAVRVVVPIKKGYQPTGKPVDLSKVRPPRQGTAVWKPKQDT